MIFSESLWTPDQPGEDPLSVVGRLTESLQPWLAATEAQQSERGNRTFRLSEEQRFLGEMALRQFREIVHNLHESDEVHTSLRQQLEEHCSQFGDEAITLGNYMFPDHARLIVAAYSDVQEALRHKERPGHYL